MTAVAQQLIVRVETRSIEAEDIVALRLAASNGELLPPFEAGAHIDVHAGQGRVRQYSLCNPSARPTHYEIAVLKEPASRGGSRFMHDDVSPGTELVVSAPKNHFALVKDVPVLLFAGGIGITPLLAMAQQLADQGRCYELHYCSRNRKRAAFMSRLEQAHFAGQVHFHFDDGDASQRLDVRTVLAGASPTHHLYVCGPAGFIQHVLETATDAGWGNDRLHREFFAAPASAVHEAEGAFDIVLASSGRSFTVSPGRTALAVLHDAGIDVPSSCETGVCGTCVTRVLEGTPDHRDLYLTDDEHARNDCFTPCCSRALTKRIVVDL